MNSGSYLRGIFRDELEPFALDFEGVGGIVRGEVRGDLLEGLGRDVGDFGEAEVSVAEASILQDEVIGVAPADAGVAGAELVPR